MSVWVRAPGGGRVLLGHSSATKFESETTMWAKAETVRGAFGYQAGAAAGESGPSRESKWASWAKGGLGGSARGESNRPAGKLGRGKKTMDEEGEIEGVGSGWLGRKDGGAA